MLSESAASDAVFTVLDEGQDYGSAGPSQKVQARAQIRVIADAFAKCIPHLVTNGTVSTSILANVTGAVPGPPPTAGAVAGSGSGSIAGLTAGAGATSTGLAGAILAVLEGGQNYPPDADVEGAREQLVLLADACALFAPYVMANAQVSTTDTGVSTTPLGTNGATNGQGTGVIT